MERFDLIPPWRRDLQFVRLSCRASPASAGLAAHGRNSMQPAPNGDETV
jgi:hypothetical protein